MQARRRRCSPIPLAFTSITEQEDDTVLDLVINSYPGSGQKKTLHLYISLAHGKGTNREESVPNVNQVGALYKDCVYTPFGEFIL